MRGREAKEGLQETPLSGRVVVVVNLSELRSSSLNRIRRTCERPPSVLQGDTQALSNTSSSNPNSGENNGGHAMGDGDENTPRLSNRGDANNMQTPLLVGGEGGDNALEDPAGNSNPAGDVDLDPTGTPAPNGKAASGHPPRGKPAATRDWDSYSADSIAGGVENGAWENNRHGDEGPYHFEEPQVITGADLYKYNQGGVPYGNAVSDDKRAQLIAEAIQALMEGDD